MEYWRDVSEIQKLGPKKLSADFLFFQFSFVALLSHWYQHWVKAAQHVLKHAEKQSETRRVQSFGPKSGASAAKPHANGGLAQKWASAPPAQQFEYWFESPDAPLSNAV